jgi:hypothetical protein
MMGADAPIPPVVIPYAQNASSGFALLTYRDPKMRVIEAAAGRPSGRRQVSQPLNFPGTDDISANNISQSISGPEQTYTVA